MQASVPMSKRPTLQHSQGQLEGRHQSASSTLLPAIKQDRGVINVHKTPQLGLDGSHQTRSHALLQRN